MAQRSRWFRVILVGRWPAGSSEVVIVRLRSGEIGVAEVLEQQRGQVDQQVGAQGWRQLVPAWDRLGEWRDRRGRGGTPGWGPEDDMAEVPPCWRDVADTSVPVPREPER